MAANGASVDRAAIVAFVERHASPPPRGALASRLVDPESRSDPTAGTDDLLRHYGIAGDDAFEFMEAFGKDFDVDLSGYRWIFHHNDEGYHLSFIRFHSASRAVARIPISIDLLLAAAKSGVWPVDYPQGVMEWAVRRQRAWERAGMTVFLGFVASILLSIVWLSAEHRAAC
ncbi:MAG: DUF1493 family protein [Pseudomonadota bacterium]